MDNAGPDGAFFFFWNIVGCCNFTEAKSRGGVYGFTGQGAISQKLNDACNRTLRLPLEYVKICRSGVSFVAFGCLDGQILVRKFTKFDRVCTTTRRR